MTISLNNTQAVEAIHLAEIFTELTEREYNEQLEQDIMLNILTLEEETD